MADSATVSSSLATLGSSGWVPSGDPRYAGSTSLWQSTWANRPVTGSISIGQQLLVNDVGVGGGAIFVWDGSRWRPSNGQVVLGRSAGTIAAPVATMSLAAATTQVFTLPSSVQIPAGMAIAGGSSVFARASFLHHGVAGTVAVRIGANTAANSINQTLQSVTLAASEASQCTLYADLDIKTLAAQTAHSFASLNVALTAGNLADVAIDFTIPQFIVFGVVSGSSGTATDTLDLLSYEVFFRG